MRRLQSGLMCSQDYPKEWYWVAPFINNFDRAVDVASSVLLKLTDDMKVAKSQE